jgi:SAM-dependent methyltransferase
MSSRPEFKAGAIFPCDICGSTKAIEAPHAGEYTGNQPIHICKDCGLVYYRQRRSPEEIARYWDEVLYGNEKDNQDSYDPNRPIFASRYAYSVSFLKKHLGTLKHKKVFDIGIGEGQFLEKIREEGAEVFGVESSARNCRMLKKKKIPHYFGTIEKYDSEMSASGKKADIVTLIFVLQNSQSATDMIRAAHRILKEKKHLLIVMGSRILVPFKKPLGTYLNTLPQDEQPYHFSIGTLQCLLAKCHFRIVATNHYWDDDLMVVLAEKRPESEDIEWLRDDYRAVSRFFTDWHKASQDMKRYIKFLPIPEAFPTFHTFYDSVRTAGKNSRKQSTVRKGKENRTV